MATSVDALCPRPFSVKKTRREAPDVFTFELQPDAPFSFAPGQFNMLYAFGVGEVPISISGAAHKPERLVHTIREVGPVTQALGQLRTGDQVGVRGPFGNSWPIDEHRQRDIVIVAGGIGLAPLRPVIYEVLKHRTHYRRLCIAYGARAPSDLIFQRELERWAERRDLQFDVTVDRGDAHWAGTTGVVTRLLARLYARPERATAFLCGPEVMLRLAARELIRLGFDPASLYVSAERSMKCAVGSCGRCQLGPHFICKDGPVFRYEALVNLLNVREL